MRTRYLLGLSLVAALSGWASVAAQNPASPSQNTVDFARDIQPILQASCYECHGPQKTKAHLRLDSRAGITKGGESGAIVVTGNSEQSLIVRRVLGLDGDDRMPKDGDPLPPAQIALMRAWIDQGAKWPSTEPAPASQASGTEEPVHWAYRRPSRPPLPDVRKSAWVRTPIDRFVLARLEKEGLSPSAEAALETLVRRVSLDLTPFWQMPNAAAKTPRMRRLSTDCWRHRITVNAGPGPGWISRVTPIPRGSKRIFRASCGNTGIG